MLDFIIRLLFLGPDRKVNVIIGIFSTDVSFILKSMVRNKDL
jgi:hypothetical protein